MRTRMYGGVGGEDGRPSPLSRLSGPLDVDAEKRDLKGRGFSRAAPGTVNIGL